MLGRGVCRSMSGVTKVGLRVDAGEGAAPEDLGELTLQLREELLQLDVQRVDLVTLGAAPTGTKSGGALAAGALTVSLIQSSGVLAAVVEAVRAWVSRRGGRSVKLELDGEVLEVTGVSSREQGRLIQTFIDRHAGPVSPDAGR